MRGTLGSARAARRVADTPAGSRAPLRHAVRFVDREQRERRTLEEIEATRRDQPLGRDVEEIELARDERALDLLRLGRAERRIEERRTHAGQTQRVDLILHQGDERRYDHARALAHEGRHLVAERLAPAGGHQDQGIAARADMFDDPGLRAAKARVTEDVAQHGKRSLAEREGGGRHGSRAVYPSALQCNSDHVRGKVRGAGSRIAALRQNGRALRRRPRPPALAPAHNDKGEPS